ncbi:MAG: 30S ribosomal protein S20 [Rickettsiales bacterium]|mgnify:CR=1 FL=1|nr:30S ribosomal protein S20 [Rickettsiales bacterium]|tara:strand:- start:3284 stop:3553 length:270 start_codon:yes stop_codon:yes gene_type:complete
MANHKSALKRIRQNEKIRLRNRIQRGNMRSAIKAARTAIEQGSLEEARGLFLRATALIDSTASKGVIHRNTASRKISRLARAFNKAAAN